MTDDESTHAIRERVLEALDRHRRLSGGPALGALQDSVVMRVIVEALDEERAAREAAAKAERKRTAAAAESTLGRWRELLGGEIDRLDANALAQVAAHIGADVEARSRGRAADDDSWVAAMTIQARAWWSAVADRPRAAGPLILEQLRRAFGALAGGSHADR